MQVRARGLATVAGYQRLVPVARCVPRVCWRAASSGSGVGQQSPDAASAAPQTVAAQAPAAEPVPASTLQAPATERVVIYESKDPMLVLTIARALALKSYAAGVAAATSLYSQVSKYASVDELQAVLMGHRHELGLPDIQLGSAFAFLALGLLARQASAFVRNRITVRLEVERPVAPAVGDAAAAPSSSPVSPSPVDPLQAATYAGHTVHIHSPRLWRRSLHNVLTVPRASIEGAAANSVITNFRFLHPSSGRQHTRWLFPVKGWKSGDLPYLKTLLYARFFRPEERPPPPDAALIRIEGFGQYRPAQFADPAHPKFVWLPPEEEGKRLEGTPFTVREGTVWADFKIPRPLTLEEKRTKARNIALYGSATATIHPALAGKVGTEAAQLGAGGTAPLPVPLSGLDAVAAPASDVFLMVDGTRFEPEQWPPAPGTWGDASSSSSNSSGSGQAAVEGAAAPGAEAAIPAPEKKA